MADIPGQSQEERRLLEAIALAQSIVEENEIKSKAPETQSEVPQMPDPGAGKNRKMWAWVLAVSVIVLGVCGFLIVRYVMGHSRSLRAEEKLRMYVEENTEKQSSALEETETSETESRVWYPELKVDFAGLKGQNKDICAWIIIPGTDVNYPVLQGTDNSYYLSHDAYGEYSPDGSIFVDAGCSSKFTDFDTIVYGHNMTTGTMFKTLHNYENEEFWEDNRNIYVYLPDTVIRYEVFAAYRTNDRHILTYNDFSDMETRKNYLSGIAGEDFDQGIVKNDQDIDIDSQILTLSTCCGMDGKRWLVQAVKIDDAPLK